MKLTSNFFHDWISILKDILENDWGYDIKGISDEELPLLYLNVEQRRPDTRKRKVVLSDSFSCPEQLRIGWNKLKCMVETGQDITPYLSKKIKSLGGSDPMLNDWGIHHFHLGENIKNGFIERTGPLLFSIVKNDIFYAIGVYEHGDWADYDIVETIHRNWPDIILHHKIKGVITATNISSNERLALRNKNANALINVSDGSVYGPLGGGVVSSGHNIKLILMIDKQKNLLESLEKRLQSNLHNMENLFFEHGYSGEPEIEAKLEISGADYYAIFPKFNVAIKLMPNS
ncbi:TPA: hypothetical protein F3L11_12840 [Aeromonas hydrophila]|uniref:hypothetical protein n=1 Tax=Aeromonas hydrophila TaxID=644 RepID=UPI001112D05E|nr:hypothetical protein [Aeromonas hydrophila]HAU4875860.1 hypothetical protein [Aeromonas hydrophila]HAU4920636.1 hypothetical protein [Aeromonas hydrophila]